MPISSHESQGNLLEVPVPQGSKVTSYSLGFDSGISTAVSNSIATASGFSYPRCSSRAFLDITGRNWHLGAMIHFSNLKVVFE